MSYDGVFDIYKIRSSTWPDIAEEADKTEFEKHRESRIDGPPDRTSGVNSSYDSMLFPPLLYPIVRDSYRFPIRRHGPFAI